MVAINTVVLGAAFPGEKANLIKKVCEQRGESQSNMIRRLVYRELAELSYLSPEEKKALGVNNDEE